MQSYSVTTNSEQSKKRKHYALKSAALVLAARVVEKKSDYFWRITSKIAHFGSLNCDLCAKTRIHAQTL